MKKITELTDGQVAFLNGLLDPMFFDDDVSDGVWAAICQDLIRGSGEFEGYNPYDVWIQWVEQTSKEMKP